MDIRQFVDNLDCSHPYTTDKEHIYLLSLRAKEINAKNILEIGSCFGHSVAAIAYACPDAKVCSVDLCDCVPNSYREDYWRYLGLTNVMAIQDSSINFLLSCKKENKKFDFVFLDAEHGNKIIPEYLIGYEIVNKGGIFTCHDWDQITMREALIEYWSPIQFEVLKDDKNRELLIIKK